LSSSDDSAIRPRNKKLEEINLQNRLFWEAKSEKLRKQLKRWPELAALASKKIEFKATVRGIKNAPGMEKTVGKLVEGLGIAVKLTAREQKIWSVIQQGLKGAQYCRELHNSKLKACKAWIEEDCPSTYPEAYKEGGPWPKRIQDEKHRIRIKAELAELVKK
jgi:hypothetical protein